MERFFTRGKSGCLRRKDPVGRIGARGSEINRRVGDCDDEEDEDRKEFWKSSS